ncbi:MAG TPA: hypothetical protein VFM25_03450 [Verrucomicrobiae bacterium]|nr:hypothetical protein [Verrucomicrobiae bacterium]
MPFDPTFPVTNAPLASATFRAQFNSLKDLIDALTTQVSGLQAQCNSLQGQVDGLSDTVAEGFTDRPTFDEALAMIQANAATNIDSISTLSQTFSNPPTPAELNPVVTKLNDVITGLKA